MRTRRVRAAALAVPVALALSACSGSADREAGGGHQAVLDGAAGSSRVNIRFAPLERAQAVHGSYLAPLAGSCGSMSGSRCISPETLTSSSSRRAGRMSQLLASAPVRSHGDGAIVSFARHSAGRTGRRGGEGGARRGAGRAPARRAPERVPRSDCPGSGPDQGCRRRASAPQVIRRSKPTVRSGPVRVSGTVWRTSALEAASRSSTAPGSTTR